MSGFYPTVTTIIALLSRMGQTPEQAIGGGQAREWNISQVFKEGIKNRVVIEQ